MCVIMVKPKGKDFPKIGDMLACWQHNPDGAGIMYNDGYKVRIEKGFMKWADFEKRIKHLSDILDPDETTLVCHFRIATHGEVSRECCHPFPISASLDDLRRCKCATEMGIAHNGIIQGQNTSALKSDTMDYIMSVVAPVYAEMGSAFVESKNMRNLIENTINGSRMVFLLPDGSYTLIGSWSLDDGCYYSNLLHKPHANWYNSYYDSLYYDTSDIEMDEPPSELCEYLCDDYELCVMAREWYCLNEAEAMDIIEECLKREAMRADYSGLED